MSSIPPRPTVPVAVGILCRPDGTLLFASRPAGKPWAGYWEFPGGKIEAGESPRHALERELEEELGIRVVDASPWIVLRHDYQHTRVELHCFRVHGWQGEPQSREGQQLSWQSPLAPALEPLLPANHRLLRAWQLPSLIGISHTEGRGDAFLAALDRALQRGLKWVHIRENQLPDIEDFARKAVRLTHRHHALVSINGDAALAHRVQADGLHLSAAALASLDARPDFPLIGASCHDAAELDRAEQFGCDYALLSPVLPTASHPGAATLGWHGFATLIAGRSLPVYALGGMEPGLLATAQQHGAQGIALLRGLWQ